MKQHKQVANTHLSSVTLENSGSGQLTSLYRESMVTTSTNEQPSVRAAASDMMGGDSDDDRVGRFLATPSVGVAVGEAGEKGAWLWDD